MNRDLKLEIGERMAKNIEFFSNKVKNENDNDVVLIMSELLGEILNEIIKLKFVRSFEKDNEMSNLAFNETSSFHAKIETCYELQAFGQDVRAILIQIDYIKDDFQSFGDFNTRSYIKEVVRLSRSELFDLILRLIGERKLPGIQCDKLDDLLDSLGYRGTLQFIYAVLAAALLENLFSM